jgi:hypothetical protein
VGLREPTPTSLHTSPLHNRFDFLRASDRKVLPGIPQRYDPLSSTQQRAALESAAPKAQNELERETASDMHDSQTDRMTHVDSADALRQSSIPISTTTSQGESMPDHEDGLHPVSPLSLASSNEADLPLSYPDAHSFFLTALDDSVDDAATEALHSSASADSLSNTPFNSILSKTKTCLPLDGVSVFVLLSRHSHRCRPLLLSGTRTRAS